ncbi:MAG: redoxin family protein [Bacteroidetes bacterium]|nr:redoxin family protein [Bacteroidota bacterium]
MALEVFHREAPDLYGTVWLHSKPLQLSTLENRVIVLHFFDSASLKCVESLQFVRMWARHYGECGVIVIGVHVPQYSFGKNPLLVEESLQRFNVWYPVVIDNDGLIALAYNVQELPTFFLVDRERRLRFKFTGDGNIVEFERALRQLVSECGFDEELPEVLSLKHHDEDEQFYRVRTIDIALGYTRGFIGNPEGHSPESIVEYSDPHYYLPDRCYFHGQWLSEREAMRCFNDQGYCVVQYDAKDVYALLGSERELPVEVTVEVDGKVVPESDYGRDLIQSHRSTSILVVSTARLYHILSHQTREKHTLKLIPSSSNVAFYALATTSHAIADVVHLN